jgi:hypothetical protein
MNNTLHKIPILLKLMWSFKGNSRNGILTLYMLLSHNGILGGKVIPLDQDCACVWIYLVANLFLLCSFEKTSLFYSRNKWKNFAKHGLSF